MSDHKPTFETPSLNFKSKLEKVKETATYAVDALEEYAMAYIADLEAKVAEQDELILSQSDELIDLKRRLEVEYD